MSSRYLIRGGCVLTLAPKAPNHPSADVLVEDGRIAEIGTGLRARDAEVIDAEDCIVMPGFVDSHRHFWKSLFRNLGTTSTDVVDATALSPEDVHDATLIGLLAAARAGITTAVDWADAATDPERAEAVRQAHLESGIRTVLVHPTGPDGSDDGLSTLAGHDDGPVVAFGSVDLVPDNAGRIAGDWARARQMGLRIHAHAGIVPEAAGMVADLHTRDLLGPDVTLVHCTHLDDADLDAVAASGTTVAVAPAAEMADGSGAPPLQKLLDRHIQPGLAVDDELVSPGDMFIPMRAGNSIQHAAYFDLKLAGKAGLPNLLTTRDIIGYATGTAARTAGVGSATGSLEPGKEADVVVFRTRRRNIYPINDPIGAVVWGMDTSNIDWVFVAGRPVVREGESVADVTEAGRRATAARDRVLAATGAAPAWTPRSA